jgi:tetratricopeptide (TPR) repeat protein
VYDLVNEEAVNSRSSKGVLHMNALKHRVTVLTMALVLAGTFGVQQAMARAKGGGKGGGGGGGEMVFAPVEVGKSKPESKTMKRAIKFYENKDYYSASIFLHKVLNGKEDDVTTKERAEFFMGKTLYHLRFYSASLSYFDKIVEKGDAHKYYKATLIWLASLQRKLPESAGILDKIGKYPESALEAPELASIRDELYFYLGRFFYRQGDRQSWDKAIKLFGRLGEDSKFYIRAKFFEGVTFVRRGFPVKASGSFKLILRKAARAKRKGPGLVMFEELAKLNLARVFYQAGQIALAAAQQSKQERMMRLYGAAKKMFSLAIKYYEEIPQESPTWLQSLFEESWSFFMLDAELRRIFKQDFAGFQKALGNIHTLNAPFFENYFFPESFILRAVIYFKNCRYRAASESVKEFQKIYMPLFTELKKVTKRHKDDNNEYYNFAVKIIKGTSDLSEVIGRFAKTALSDRTLKRQFDYVHELDRELKQVESAARDWKTTAIADSIVQDLSLQKSLAVAKAGEMSRRRLTRLRKEIQGLLVKANNILYEVNNVKLGRIDKIMRGQMIKIQVKLQKVRVDDEHVIWPFTGEYWKDELGYYRFQVRNKCAAASK